MITLKKNKILAYQQTIVKLKIIEIKIIKILIIQHLII